MLARNRALSRHCQRYSISNALTRLDKKSLLEDYTVIVEAHIFPECDSYPLVSLTPLLSPSTYLSVRSRGVESNCRGVILVRAE